ncbi:hypothetical protein PDIDSM_5046 [Penicillium digitatum]|nr:hypothetical protein PDIDSM_5046 [Penicillium digitatum]
MRLPYVADPPATSTPDEARILASVQARRAPNPLLPLDLALLHSYPVTEGWNSFIGAIRTRTTLTTVIRELAICRVAVVNGALFEWEQHAPLLTEGGLGSEAMKVIGDAQADFSDAAASLVLSADQRAVLKYTDAMTKTVTVPDEVFAELKGCFNEREVVEITATIAAYNCGYSLSTADIAWGALRRNCIAVSTLKRGTLVSLTSRYKFLEDLYPWAISAFTFSDAASRDKKLAISKEGTSYEYQGSYLYQIAARAFYLHIGYAKNALLACFPPLLDEKYSGTLILRFDDNNPSNKKQELEDAIVEGGELDSGLRTENGECEAVNIYAIWLSATERKAYNSNPVLSEFTLLLLVIVDDKIRAVLEAFQNAVGNFEAREAQGELSRMLC